MGHPPRKITSMEWSWPKRKTMYILGIPAKRLKIPQSLGYHTVPLWAPDFRQWVVAFDVFPVWFPNCFGSVVLCYVLTLPFWNWSVYLVLLHSKHINLFLPYRNSYLRNFLESQKKLWTSKQCWTFKYYGDFWRWTKCILHCEMTMTLGQQQE